MRFLLRVTVMLTLASCLVSPAWAEVFYSNDFENPNDPLTEWSNSSSDITPGTPNHSADRFLGQFQSESTILTLTGLPTHSQITIAFDLYVIGSWDGHATGSGPDIWDLSVDGGPVLFHTTFSNTSNPQTYSDTYPGGTYPAGTGAAETNTLGYPLQNPPYADAVYSFPNDQWEFTFAHSAESLVLVFSSDQTETHPDETWGLDNVVITPEPTALSLLGLGTLVLRRRRV